MAAIAEDRVGETLDRRGHTEAVHFRLTGEELAVLDARWREEGFKNRSAYVRHLVRAAADAPTGSPAAIDAARDATRQLGALGRNLNQTVRAIHEQRRKGAVFDPQALLEVEDIEGLRDAVAALRSVLGGFLTGLKDRRVGGRL